MPRLVAIGAALLLILAIVVWWPVEEEVGDDSELTPANAAASTNFPADVRRAQQVEVSSKEEPASTAIDVANHPAAIQVSDPLANVGTNAQPKCLRKEATKPDAAFELNASLRNNEPSTLDKKACYAAVDQIKRARWMFDSTPTQTVAYTPRADINWLGVSVQETVLHELCSGDLPYEATSEAKIVLFFVTATETSKILIGPNWVSEGTIQSPLTQEQYANITKALSGRRRDVVGPGGNMSPKIFDKRMQARYYNQVVAEAEAQEQRADELRRAQRGLLSTCAE
jgi:hypothetical protein